MTCTQIVKVRTRKADRAVQAEQSSVVQNGMCVNAVGVGGVEYCTCGPDRWVVWMVSEQVSGRVHTPTGKVRSGQVRSGQVRSVDGWVKNNGQSMR